MEMIFMNKMSKIFLVIIVILLIALGIITSLYFNMRTSAKTNLNYFLNEVEQKRIVLQENQKLEEELEQLKN